MLAAGKMLLWSRRSSRFVFIVSHTTCVLTVAFCLGSFECTPHSPIVIVLGRMALLCAAAALANPQTASERAAEANDSEASSTVESDSEDKSDSDDSFIRLWIDELDSALLQNCNNICKMFSCTSCSCIQTVDKNVNIGLWCMCVGKAVSKSGVYVEVRMRAIAPI